MAYHWALKFCMNIQFDLFYLNLEQIYQSTLLNLLGVLWENQHEHLCNRLSHFYSCFLKEEKTL